MTQAEKVQTADTRRNAKGQWEPGAKNGWPKGKSKQPKDWTILTKNQLGNVIRRLYEVATKESEVKDALKACEMLLKLCDAGSKPKASKGPRAIIAALKEMDQ